MFCTQVVESSLKKRSKYIRMFSVNASKGVQGRNGILHITADKLIENVYNNHTTNVSTDHSNKYINSC